MVHVLSKDGELPPPARSQDFDSRGCLAVVAVPVLLLVAVTVAVSVLLSSSEGSPALAKPARGKADAPASAVDDRSDEAAPDDVPETGAEGTRAERYPFSDQSVWRQSVRDAPLNDNSDRLVEHLAESVYSRYAGVAAFNVNQYNVAYFVVGGDTLRTDVAFDDCQDKGSTPSGLFDGDAHFADVPIPEGAVPAEGRDGALVVYAPDSDQLWEFWRASETQDGWQACWGGRIDNVSENPGYFDGPFGTTATGLSHAGGMISLADVRAGRIDHAVALLAAEPATFKTFSWPAQRSDGYSDDPDAVPEGLRLRLASDVDVQSLDLHPIAKMVALAAQEYGFVVVDKAGATGVYTESGAAPDGGVDPWEDILDGTPSYLIMDDFPWDELEALPTDYGKPDGE